MPSHKVSRQLLASLGEASPSRAPRELPDYCLEAGDRLRCDAPSRYFSAGEAEAQELAETRFGDRAPGLVDLQLETSGGRFELRPFLSRAGQSI